MAPRLSFSGETLTLDEIAAHHAVVLAAIRDYHTPSNPAFTAIFAGATPAEIQKQLVAHEREADLLFSLNIVASLEAIFRMDYLRRVSERKKDSLSKSFRELYKERQDAVSLEEHILESWKTWHPDVGHLVSEFKGVLKFRHWLAHGRYWIPQFARDHDFYDVSFLAQALISDLQLEPAV